jgi:hypothetical protein
MLQIEQFKEENYKQICHYRSPSFYYYVCDKESLYILLTTGELTTNKLGFYCYHIWDLKYIIDKLSDNEIILKLNIEYLKENKYTIISIDDEITELLEKFSLNFLNNKNLEEFKCEINKENPILFANYNNKSLYDKYHILILSDYLKNNRFDELLDIVITNNDIIYNYCNEIVRKYSCLNENRKSSTRITNNIL